MARPLKVGLDYFPLDTSLEDNVELLEAEMGLDGFAILIKLWQKIYANGYYIEWSEDNALLFSRKINANINRVNDVINACLRRDLFNKTLYENNSVLTSKGIQERYFKIVFDARRKSLKVEKELILIKLELIPYLCELIPAQSTQSKVKESKEEESKEEESEEEKNKSNKYKDVFDYYITLDLIKHKKYTNQMTDAIKKAEKNLKIDIGEMKRMLNRHNQKVQQSKNTDYPTKARTLSEFFGQKKYQSTDLICSDYLDERYENEPTTRESKLAKIKAQIREQQN